VAGRRRWRGVWWAGDGGGERDSGGRGRLRTRSAAGRTVEGMRRAGAGGGERGRGDDGERGGPATRSATG
jgi:hypothetical protein